MSDTTPGEGGAAEPEALSAELSRTLDEIQRLALLAEPADELETLLRRAKALLDRLETALRSQPGQVGLGTVLELRGTIAGLMRLIPKR